MKANRSRRSSSLLLALVSLTLLLTQFNNCGNVAQPSTGLESLSVVTCSNAQCITPDPGNLRLVPHLQGTSFSVPMGLAEFNIGGDCNEGGYPTNMIQWELMLGGTAVRNSNQSVAGGGPANSTCVNGRFLLYINLAAFNGDPVDRSGLKTSNGSRSNYTLNVIISGSGVSGGAPASYRSSVPLQML